MSDFPTYSELTYEEQAKMRRMEQSLRAQRSADAYASKHYPWDARHFPRPEVIRSGSLFSASPAPTAPLANVTYADAAVQHGLLNHYAANNRTGPQQGQPSTSSTHVRHGGRGSYGGGSSNPWIQALSAARRRNAETMTYNGKTYYKKESRGKNNVKLISYKGRP